MNRLWLMVLAVSACGQTVSNIRFDGIGDSSARTIWDVSSAFTNFRVRYGTADCAVGSGGTVQTNSTATNYYFLYAMTANLTGLAPSTTYFGCPEVSSDNGSTWSAGVSATFTTLARTQTLPIPPTPVPTTFPVQTGTLRNVLANCSNLQAQINAALPGDTIMVPAGTICTAGNYTTPTASEAIKFVPSAVRTSDSQITLPGHPFLDNQEVRLSSSGPNTNCLPGMLILPAQFGWNCDHGGGWRPGARYWVHKVDANNVQIIDGVGGNPVIPGAIQFTANVGAGTINFAPTPKFLYGFYVPGSAGIPAGSIIQLVSSGTLPGGLAVNTNYFTLSACNISVNVACSFQLSRTMGGMPVPITSAGTGTHTIVDQGLGSMWIMPVPPALGTGHDILLTSGGALPAPGVRTSPGFDTQGFHIRQTATVSTSAIFSPGVLSHNWRIVGAILDTATNSDYLTTSDPRPYCGILSIRQDVENFIFDRSRVQGAGFPNRFGCINAMFFDGANVGFINSDLRGMDYWHPWVDGFNATFNATSATFSIATVHGGKFNARTAGNTVVTITAGSGATGNVYVWFDMSGNLNVLPPSGVSGTCTTSGAPTCTVLPGVMTPAWPVDVNGRIAGVKAGLFSLSGGNVTAAYGQGNPYDNFGFPTAPDSMTGAPGGTSGDEGSNPLISGNGPGPYIFDNNWISGTGIPLHFDDGGGPWNARGDYTITRNTFDVPLSQIYGQPGSDGFRYGNRNSLEWKGGQRIKVDGNIFQGAFSEASPACLTVAVNPRNGGVISDFDFTNNTVTGCGGIMSISATDSTGASIAGKRTRVYNNVFMLNGWRYSAIPVVGGVPIGSHLGWTIESFTGSEDVLIDHNTVYDSRGSLPSLFYPVIGPIGGMAITNNIYFYTGNQAMLSTDNGPNGVANCVGRRDKALMDCAFTSGPGNPSYTFSHNLLVPSWSDTSLPSGFVGAQTVSNAFPAPLVNAIPNGNSLAQNLDLIKFASAIPGSPALDLRLGAASPHLNTATDGTQVGANLDQLEAIQSRIVQLRTTLVSATSVTVSSFVPRAGDRCYVGYGTSNSPGAWTWSAADSTNSRQRNFTLTGLLSRRQYFYSVVCNHTALPSIETFRTL